MDRLPYFSELKFWDYPVNFGKGDRFQFWNILNSYWPLENVKVPFELEFGAGHLRKCWICSRFSNQEGTRALHCFNHLKYVEEKVRFTWMSTNLVCKSLSELLDLKHTMNHSNDRFYRINNVHSRDWQKKV